jgi:hypothetical protein
MPKLDMLTPPRTKGTVQGNLRPIATQGVAQVMFVTMSRFKAGQPEK